LIIAYIWCYVVVLTDRRIAIALQRSGVRFPSAPPRKNTYGTVKAWLDERGLADKAVANPDDLAPDQLADAAADLLTRTVEDEFGHPIDPRGLRVAYAPPPPEMTEEQLADLESKGAALLPGASCESPPTSL
jgi:hypothetical protein